MKINSPFVKTSILTLITAFCLSSCNNEKQTVVEESLRLISKATVEMQDINSIEVKQLKEIPQNLQDSLALLQNRHPDVVLNDEDNEQIKSAMAKFTEAQDNAIKVFSARIEQLQKSVAKLNGQDVDESDSLDNNADQTSYSYATFFWYDTNKQYSFLID